MILNMIFLRAESLTVPFHLDLVFFVRKLGQHSVQRSVNGDGQKQLFFPPPLKSAAGTEGAHVFPNNSSLPETLLVLDQT